MVDKVSTVWMLINEIQKHPWLFDLNRLDYRDLKKKERSWHAIARAVGLNVDQCMQKWRNLRDRYARELRIMRRKSEAAGRKIESSWPLMHRLEFLFNHVKHRSIDSAWCPSDVSNNVQNEDSEPCTESEMSISVSGGVDSDLKEIVIPNLPNINAFDDGSQPPNPTINNNNNSDGSWLPTPQALPMEQNTDFPSPCSSIAGYSGVSVNKKRSLEPPDEQEGSVILCNSPKSRPYGGDDEEHHFGMIVASKLRRLPEKIRDEVEIEILQLLLKVAK